MNNIVSEDNVRDALYKVIDPELGLSIVDLGLIYKIEVKKGNNVYIEMTLTFPGCPFGPQIMEEADEIVRKIPSVETVTIELVWNPMWSPNMIPKEVRDVMGIILPS